MSERKAHLKKSLILGDWLKSLLRFCVFIVLIVPTWSVTTVKMYNLLSGLKDYFKRQEIIIDNPIFRIHCTFTTVLLITFSMIITWTQFVGQPIRCIVEGVPTHVVNTYCWIMTTFTMPGKFRASFLECVTRGLISEWVLYPDFPRFGILHEHEDKVLRIRKKYYSWQVIMHYVIFLCYCRIGPLYCCPNIFFLRGPTQPNIKCNYTAIKGWISYS